MTNLDIDMPNIPDTNLSITKYTPDGRPAGTPHFNLLEKNLSIQRYSFILSDMPEFYQDKIVCDIGMGYGIGANVIAKNGAKKVIAIDFNEEAIKIAQEYYAHPNIVYTCEDILQMKTTDLIDIIVAVEMVEHVTDKELNVLLQTWYESLTEDGLLYITTPERRAEKSAYPMGSHWTEYDYKELVDIIEQFGFCMVWSKRKGETDGVSMALLFQKV